MILKNLRVIYQFIKSNGTVSCATGKGRKKTEKILFITLQFLYTNRYVDEHTEENTTLPSPAPKKRRGASPAQEKEKEPEKEKPKPEVTAKAKTDKMKLFNTVSQV